MRTVNGRFADITILVTFGYEITRPRKDQKDRSEVDYGLLADFLDGALSVSSKETKFVDAWELSYGFKNQKQFQQAYDATKIKGPEKWTSEPERFRQQVRVGFGLWLDNDWDIHGWNEKDFSKNYFTPPAFEQSVRAALTVSDEYVWIYSGTPRWWTNEKLPRAYIDALKSRPHLARPLIRRIRSWGLRISSPCGGASHSDKMAARRECDEPCVGEGAIGRDGRLP